MSKHVIKCPKCGEVFQVDEAGYSAIVAQVRNKEFEKELEERKLSFEREKEEAISRAIAETKNDLSKQISIKVNEITELQAKINSFENEKKSAVIEATSAIKDELNEKNSQIKDLEAKIESADKDRKIAINEAVKDIEKKRDELQYELKAKDKEQEAREESLKKQYEKQLKSKNELIDYYKDFKAKLNTKMIGESLEQHCEIEFNRLRATGFQNAYFEKDNEIKNGSKGDYIYREYDNENNEIISIMFEMKNQEDETATKKKNEAFLKKLDKDRNNKNCEYAILVSLLEPDNDLYNSGIVDMSYKYEKMYVVRPQFFIPIITILRNAAEKSMKYKKELDRVRNQNIDITHFESNIETFKNGFSKNYKDASESFNMAIKNIDDAIKMLEKIKTNLTNSEDSLDNANKMLENFTVERLTKDNPTMIKKFAELEQGK